MTRDEIVKAARSYLGIPWHHEGRSRSGLDCIGLVCAVANDMGVPYEDMKGYDRTPSDLTFFNHLRKHTVPNLTGQLPPGTIGIFRQSRFPCHVGIFSEIDGVKHIIHAYVPRHKVVEERYIPSASFGLVMALDYPGVSD